MLQRACGRGSGRAAGRVGGVGGVGRESGRNPVGLVSKLWPGMCLWGAQTACGDPGRAARAAPPAGAAAHTPPAPPPHLACGASPGSARPVAPSAPCSPFALRAAAGGGGAVGGGVVRTRRAPAGRGARYPVIPPPQGARAQGSPWPARCTPCSVGKATGPPPGKGVMKRHASAQQRPGQPGPRGGRQGDGCSAGFRRPGARPAALIGPPTPKCVPKLAGRDRAVAAAGHEAVPAASGGRPGLGGEGGAAVGWPSSWAPSPQGLGRCFWWEVGGGCVCAPIGGRRSVAQEPPQPTGKLPSNCGGRAPRGRPVPLRLIGPACAHPPPGAPPETPGPPAQNATQSMASGWATAASSRQSPPAGL